MCKQLPPVWASKEVCFSKTFSDIWTRKLYLPDKYSVDVVILVLLDVLPVLVVVQCMYKQFCKPRPCVYLSPLKSISASSLQRSQVSLMFKRDKYAKR